MEKIRKQPGKKIGAQFRYDDSVKAEALGLLKKGYPVVDVAAQMGVTRNTIHNWKKKQKEKEGKTQRVIDESVGGMHDQIARLSKVKNPSGATAHKIILLSKAIERLEKKKPVTSKKDKGKTPEIEMIGGLDDRLRTYEDTVLRLYQRELVQDTSRYRCMLKGRQTGISFTCAYMMVQGAMTRRVDQNLVSTSLFQTKNTLRYCRQHMTALGIREKGKGSSQEIVFPNDVIIRALPANQATSQGWPGDVVFDEMAWYRHSKDVWNAIVPSVTAINGRVTCVSTPYEAGPHNQFWVIATNDNNEYPLFARHQCDIHRAVREGLEINLPELKSLFDEDTWQRLYLLQFFSDEDSFFSLEELNDIRGDCLNAWTGDDRRAGWDIAKRVDASELVGVELLNDHVYVRGVETWRKLAYNLQKQKLMSALRRWQINELHIDGTGVGVSVEDFIRPDISIRQHWHTFTQEFKAGLAQTLKKLVEERRITLPVDDRQLISQFLNIKRSATATGIRYDISRNADGHGDRFWALALACHGLDFNIKGQMISCVKRKIQSILKGYIGR